MTRPPPNDIQLYSDHLHPVILPHGRNRKRPLSSLPANVIDAPRRSWCEDAEAALAVRLKRLACDESLKVNGITVTRTDAFAEALKYQRDIVSKLLAALDRSGFEMVAPTDAKAWVYEGWAQA